MINYIYTRFEVHTLSGQCCVWKSNSKTNVQCYHKQELTCKYCRGMQHVTPLLHEWSLGEEPGGLVFRRMQLEARKKNLKMFRFFTWQEHVPSSASVHRGRHLSCPGWALKGVKLLQTHEDATEIHTSCQGRSVVVIGTSFIGYRHFYSFSVLVCSCVFTVEHEASHQTQAVNLRTTEVFFH